jgi:holo-[acyl-carrier-protein] synthase
MALSIGTDIVDIDRIAASLERLGERFAERVLSVEELWQWRDKNSSVAFLGGAQAALEAMAASRVLISLSDERRYAIAYAMAVV